MGPFVFQPTGQDFLRILPELAVLLTALLVLLVDLGIGEARRHKGWLAAVGLVGVVSALVTAALLFEMGDHLPAFDNMVFSDKTAFLADIVILFSAGAGLLFSPGYIERQGITQEGEYYTLLLLAAMGMMFMASAASLAVL